LGGPEVGAGCGGRGIIHGFETLEKLGFHEWGFDYVLLDFLGDVVCGGFGLPIARDMCQKVIVVASNDLQSLYVANNVCKAVEYFRKMGGQCRRRRHDPQQGRRHRRGERLRQAVGIPVLTAIPANEDIRKKSANYQIIGKPGGQWASLFEELAVNVAEAPPLRPTPLDQDGLLGLFSADVTGPTTRSSPRRRPTCAARPLWPSRASKSCTRRFERGAGSPPRDRDRIDLAAAPIEGGCGSKDVMRDAAVRPASRDVLARYATDYPQGPHDQPQSMCPAFGSLRVGPADAPHRQRAVGLGLLRLRADLHVALLRRQAQRRLRPFSSETLVTGKLFEDIKEAVDGPRRPALYDTIIVTNLCVPTASGVPLQLLPDQINGVRVIGIDVPGFGVPTHAEAKDVLAGAMLSYAAARPSRARSPPPASGPTARPSRCWARCSPPIPPVSG
jgi:hypothetical protein